MEMMIRITQIAKSPLVVDSCRNFLTLFGEVIDLKFVDTRCSSSGVKKVSSL
uniref:Uncharacterized protein n=1 Tax=Populus trichocarpa TaxID=3694 RepID=A0A3N7FG88_POPTR